MTLLHQAAQKAVEALNHIVRRLQMDIDDGGRPDQWSMEDLVRKAQPAIDALVAALQQPEQATEPPWGITLATLNRHVSPGISLGHELNRLRQYDAAALQHQEVPAAVRDAHGNIVLHNGREVCYRDEAPPTALQQEVPREPVAQEPECKWPVRPLKKVQVTMPDGSSALLVPERAYFSAWAVQELENSFKAAAPSTTRQQEDGNV